MNIFTNLYIGYFVDTNVNNYLEVIGTNVNDNSSKTYTITVGSAAGNTYMGLHFYNARMYPAYNTTGTGCTRSGYASFKIASTSTILCN